MSVKTFTLNGNLVSAGEDQTILDVCDEQGVPIPRLCHLEGLGEIGACRLCMVEVQGINKLLPACMTRAEENMVVTTNSERLQATAGRSSSSSSPSGTTSARSAS